MKDTIQRTYKARLVNAQEARGYQPVPNDTKMGSFVAASGLTIEFEGAPQGLRTAMFLPDQGRVGFDHELEHVEDEIEVTIVFKRRARS